MACDRTFFRLSRLSKKLKAWSKRERLISLIKKGYLN